MTWQETARQFDTATAGYNDWYRDNPVFALELDALGRIRTPLPDPGLEIGVGPGHFARALGCSFGLDPAISPLQLAARRSIMTMQGIGENLPVRSGSMGTIYLLFTLCFLDDPAAVFSECRRVLRPGGRLVLGVVPRHSAWGRRIAAKQKGNHPLYRHARLRTITETGRLLDDSDFALLESWSTLLQPPGRRLRKEPALPGGREDAGFCVLVTGKKGELN